MNIFIIGKANSEVRFSVRYIKLQKLKGTFGSFTAKMEASNILVKVLSKLRLM